MTNPCSREIGGIGRHCWHPVAMLMSSSQKEARRLALEAQGSPYTGLLDPAEGWEKIYQVCCWCGQTTTNPQSSYYESPGFFAPGDIHGDADMKVPK